MTSIQREVFKETPVGGQIKESQYQPRSVFFNTAFPVNQTLLCHTPHVSKKDGRSLGKWKDKRRMILPWQAFDIGFEEHKIMQFSRNDKSDRELDVEVATSVFCYNVEK